MKRRMVALLAALSMAALLAGGCANKEVVKSEDQPAATVKEPTKVESAKPEPPKVEAPIVETKPAPEAAKVEDTDQKAKVADSALETIYFDYDKSDLRQDTRDVLYKNAEVLLKTKIDAKVRIEGNCDESGSAEYNLALGERRAKSVQQYLITLGVPADRLSTISYGKEKPAVKGHDEAAWAKNRRVEFVIVK